MKTKTKRHLGFLIIVVALLFVWQRAQNPALEHQGLFKKEYIAKTWVLGPKSKKNWKIRLGKRGDQEQHYFALHCQEKVIVKHNEDGQKAQEYVFEPGTHYFGCLGQSRFLKKETYFLSLEPEGEKFKEPVVLERLIPVEKDRLFEHTHFDFGGARSIFINSEADMAIYPTDKFMLKEKREIYPLEAWCNTGISIFKQDLIFVATTEPSLVAVRLGPKQFKVDGGEDFIKTSIGAVAFWRFRALGVSGEIYVRSELANFGCIHILRGVLAEKEEE